MDAAVGSTLTLTPTADSTIEGLGCQMVGYRQHFDFQCRFQDQKATFTVDGPGTSTITATLDGVAATVKVLALNNITKVEARAHTRLIRQ